MFTPKLEAAGFKLGAHVFSPVEMGENRQGGRQGQRR
jgi:hypothetical protein